MDLRRMIDKYDIDDGFKKEFSRLLLNISEDDLIEIMTDKLADILYQNSYDYDMNIDNGSNVRIDIEDSIKKELINLIKESD